MLEDEFEEAIYLASEEVMEENYSPSQLAAIVNKKQIIADVRQLLALTYDYSQKELSTVIKEVLIQLPGGKDWTGRIES